jgi:predicted phage tail protein
MKTKTSSILLLALGLVVIAGSVWLLYDNYVSAHPARTSSGAYIFAIGVALVVLGVATLFSKPKPPTDPGAAGD